VGLVSTTSKDLYIIRVAIRNVNGKIKLQDSETQRNIAPSVAQEILSDESLHQTAELKLNRAFDATQHKSVSQQLTSLYSILKVKQ